MQQVRKSIDVDVPIRTAYNQWTQFEEFPRFMRGVLSVRQMDDTHLRWNTRWWGGVDANWDAEIEEQTPDSRIAWKSVTGTPNAGEVTFEPLGDSRTRVNLVISYSPQGFVGMLGDLSGAIDRQVDLSLRGFKEFIELRGAPTGAWRGEVHDDSVQR